MRDAVVDGELEHLRIDHDEPALLGLHAVEHREDHGVDRDRLARAGRAGDEQVRHAGEVDDHRLAADRLAERDGEAMLRFLEVFAREQFAQVDGLAALVRQFDADGVAALDHRHAGRDRRHRSRDVVGEPDHPRRFDARRGFELIESDDGARAHVDDLALDAEIVEDALEQARVLLERVLRNFGPGRLLRLGQHRDRRHDPLAQQRGELGLARGPARRLKRRRSDDARGAGRNCRGGALRTQGVGGGIGQRVVVIAQARPGRAADGGAGGAKIGEGLSAVPPPRRAIRRSAPLAASSA